MRGRLARPHGESGIEEEDALTSPVLEIAV